MIRRAAGAMIVVAATLLGLPGIAHADAAGPTDYHSEIISITPPTTAIEVSIEGGDSFVQITVAEGHEVIVLGYEPDEEPYLRISADGRVEQNRRSFATYYNEERFGGDEIPDIVDNMAAPEWEHVGDGGRWAWHDHRAHWMGEQPPIGLEPGETMPSQLIPILVDGRSVQIEVATTLHDGPSSWPAVFGLLIGLQLVFVGLLLGPATSALSGLLLSTAALFVGLAQFRSLPAETGPVITWWLLPTIAVLCVLAIVMSYGRSRLLQSGLLALAGAQLLVWGLQRRTVLTKPVLPTDLPFWLDRSITAAVLVGAVGLVLVALREMFRADPA